MGVEENKVQKEIMDFVNEGGLQKKYPPVNFAVLYRIPNKGIKGRKSTLPDGYPDLQGGVTIKGISVTSYVEIKAEGKVCKNTDQLEFLMSERANGAIAFWCNSLDMFLEKIEPFIISLTQSLCRR